MLTNSGDAIRKSAKGVFAAVDLFLPQMPGPRLLIYHELTSTPTRQMDLTPEVFRKQVEWLGENGRTIALDEAIERIGDESSDRDFVVTFDDGHAGLASLAFPILEEHGVPFTLYITSGLIGSGPNYLTWDQIARMQASGLMTIGSHTHTHPDLRELAPSEVEMELDQSDETIESRTGVRPRHFAYPKGFWSGPAEPYVRARYDTAVLGAGPPIEDGTDLHRLSRVPVQRSDGYFFFKRKLSRGLRAEEWMRARLKGYENPAA